MLNRILVKLMVLFSVFIFVSCTTSDEYEDEAEISNSNSENVAISDEAQEGENGENVNNAAENEFESDEFNNNNGEYAENNINNYNNEGTSTADSNSTEPVEDLSMVGDDSATSNAALEDATVENAPVQTTEVEETTEESYEASVPSQETAPLPAYTQGQGTVKYVHQNTSVYGEKNSSFPVGSYEVGDHPLVIEDDGTFATTSSGKYIPSSSLTEKAVARPRTSIEFR